MNRITITNKDVANSIATEVEQATGMTCEVFSNESTSVIVCGHNTVIARVIAELFPAITVSPLCGPFVGDITEIPLAVRTFNDMKEATHALDTATSHVLNAALNH